MMNVSFIREIRHVASGTEINTDFINTVTYIESMSLDGPKILITLSDSTMLIRDDIGVQELDEISFTFSEEWLSTSGMDFTDTFTVLVIANQGEMIRMELILSAVYSLKSLASSTRIFSQRGIQEIVNSYCGSLKKELGTFPVVEDYHCIAGERPSKMFRQIAEEHGAHAWIARSTFKMETFAKLINKDHSYEYTYNKDSDYTIIKYTLPSKQNAMQEKYIRSFTGWNPTLGRIKSTSNLVTSAVAPVAQSAVNTYILSNQVARAKEAIDFTCLGNGALTAGMALKLKYYKPSAEDPINESFPEKVVIQSVAHWFESQKYYCRVKGAVKLEQK